MKKFNDSINRIIHKVLGLVELVLFVRLMLKALGANSESLAVGILYEYTDILISPFNSIFDNFYSNGVFIETVTISAMIGYAVFVFIVARLLYVFDRY